MIMAIQVVDIIVERRGMILLIKRGDFWILPGTEFTPDEDELECVENVVAREMNAQVSAIFKKLPEKVFGPSPVRGDDVEVTIYIGDISHAKMSEIKDANAHWFSKESLKALRLSNITKDVLDYYYLEKQSDETA